MRTFNDITPPSRRKEIGQDREPLDIRSERPSRFPYATLLAVLFVIVLTVGALFYFSSAKVNVTPNSISAAVQGSFTADRNEGSLPYEIITAQKIATQSVTGSGTKTVTSSASGTLTIYNTQTKAQRLITNTRFATAEGLIFRIRSAITIPGGSIARPGSISAKVYADQPGNAYNIGPTSFTVPGFAGTPQEKQVYARSTGSMTGGASGVVPIVDSAIEDQTRSALMKALAPDLTAEIEARVPSGYLLLEGAATTTFEKLEAMPSATTGMVDVREQGTITAVVFPNAALAKVVGTSIAGLGYQGEPLTLAPTSDMLFTAPRFPDPDTTSFSFTLSGTAALVYTVDPTRIAAAIAGRTRSAAEVALTNYTEVKRAVIVLRPFWRQSFPQDPSTIAVDVENP